ncbi:fructose-1-phosphate kinase [Vespula maculifrons]|uniref:Fructose-1-phosphate kinase n=1 Tax=Vespula maculifrons TaxID=7453 RepID=A0ABD2C3E9_VESMC
MGSEGGRIRGSQGTHDLQYFSSFPVTRPATTSGSVASYPLPVLRQFSMSPISEKEKDVSFEGRKRHDALSRDLGSIYTQNVEQVSTWDDQDAARPVRSSEQRAQANLKPEAPLSALLPTNNKIERFLREASTIEYRGVLSTMTIDKNSFLRSSISQNGDHSFRLWKMAEIYLKRVLSIFL